MELAWSRQRFSPSTPLSLRFKERLAGGGKRVRRIGVMGLARRLSVALWRYLEISEIPLGATFRSAASEGLSAPGQ